MLILLGLSDVFLSILTYKVTGQCPLVLFLSLRPVFLLLLASILCHTPCRDRFALKIDLNEEKVVRHYYLRMGYWANRRSCSQSCLDFNGIVLMCLAF